MLYHFDNNRCLNGWWDIKPVLDGVCTEFENGKFLVPSIWTQVRDGVRKKGSPYYAVEWHMDFTQEDYEFLYDNFGYPLWWSRCKSAYIKRNIELSKQTGKRYILVFEALGPKAVLYINQKPAAIHCEYFLPLEFDATDYLTDGSNEIMLEISGYVENDKGRKCWPAGNNFGDSTKGIWQDVYLLEKPEVYVDDVTIMTSVSKKEITLKYAIRNTTGADVNVQISPEITEFKTGAQGLIIEPFTAVAQAKELTEIEKTYRWENPKLWDNYDPNLYYLKTALKPS